MVCPLFITAHGDHHLANRFLHDIAEKSIVDSDEFKIITSSDILDLSEDLAASADSPNLTHLSNAWTGASIASIERFLLATPRQEEGEHTTATATATADREDCICPIYVVLDEAGVASETCVLAHRVLEFPTSNGATSHAYFLDRFERVRLPWAEVRDAVVNLETGNMGFEDFVGEAKEVDADGIYNPH